MLQLDRSNGGGLQTQLLDQLRRLIISGRIAPLSRMPATRSLARQLGISRTTVMLVYEELIAEGYLQTKPAAGTFVSADPPGAANGRPARAGAAAERETRLPYRGPADASVRSERPSLDFRPGGFDHRLFPAKAWQRLVSRALRDGSPDLADDHPAGSDRLRAAVAAWMMMERGVPTRRDEVIIVSGIRQACYMLSRLLLAGGFSALIDGPLPGSAAWVFENIGTDTRRLPAGSRPQLLLGAERHKFAWLSTPHPHASADRDCDWRQRRSTLLEWVQQGDGYLVEYEGLDHILFMAPPVADGGINDRTVRLGEFSPTLGLGTRMGYMLLPDSLVKAATSLKEALGGAPPPLEQAVLARFIEDGGYSRHLRRVGKVMTERRAALISALRSHFADAILDEPTAEDHLSCLLPEELIGLGTIGDRARASGLGLDVRKRDGVSGDCDAALCLSYARMNTHQIGAAVGELANLLHGGQTGGPFRGSAVQQPVANR